MSTATRCGDETDKVTMEDDLVSRTSSGHRPVKCSTGTLTTWKSSSGGGVTHQHQDGDSSDMIEEHDDHGDSGVFNSSKNTTDSLSDDADMEERGVMYFPPRRKAQLTTKILKNVETQRKNNAAYDAAEPAMDSDSEDQNHSMDDELTEVVTDKNEIEMTTIRTEVKTYRTSETNCGNFFQRHQNDLVRIRNDLQYDEAVPVSDEGPDDDHQTLYHYVPNNRLTHGQYTSMRLEEEEDYNAESPEAPVVHARFVGKPMGLPVTYSGSSLTGRKSEGVSIESDVRRRDGSLSSSQPPFGDPVNIDRLHASTTRLMDSRPASDVCNMPHGERIPVIITNRGQDRDSEGNNTDSSSKKKKKKKKNSRDEAGGDNKDVDENGNPMEYVATRTRPEYKSHTSSFTSRGSAFPRRTEDLNHFEHNGRSISEMDDQNSGGPSASDQPKKKTKVTRRKENELATSIKAENIAGYQGEKSVDELVGIIENITSNSNSSNSSNNSNKKKKKVGSIPLLNGNAEGNLTNGPVISETGAAAKSVKKVKPGNKTKASSLPKDIEKSSDTADEGSPKSEDIKNLEDVIAESTKKLIPVSNQSKKTDTAKTVYAKTNPGNMDIKMDSFKFTDIEIPRLPEEEFTVVTRKKVTRTVPGNPQTGSVSYTKDYAKDGHHNYDHVYNTGYNNAQPNQNTTASNFDFFRSKDDRVIQDERSGGHRRSRPIVRSITPPPSSFSHSSDEYAEKTPVEQRAFSPSAFPALGGRRNSTGNVPSESAPDDSDLESVKSLPLVAAGANAKTEGATPPIVSYAKIAAGPKTAGKASTVQVSGNAPSGGKEMAEFETEDVELNRRHSLTSLTDSLPVGEEELKPAPPTPAASKIATPKPTTENAVVSKVANEVTKSPETQTDETKDKTIDNNHGAKSAKPGAPAISSVDSKEGSIRKSKVNTSVTGFKSLNSGYSPQMPYCDNQLHQNITFGCSASLDIEALKPALPTPTNNTSTTILDMKDFPPISEIHAAKISAPNTDSVAMGTGKAQQPVTGAAACARVRHYSNPQTPSSSSLVSAYPTQTGTVKTTSVSNNKKQKNKSVVFLDNKRSRTSPQDLGISFGFGTNLSFMAGVSEAPGSIGAAPGSSLTAPAAAAPAVSEVQNDSDPKQGAHGPNGIVPVLYDLIHTGKTSTQNNTVVDGASTTVDTTDSLTVIKDTRATPDTTVLSDTPQPCGTGATEKAVAVADVAGSVAGVEGSDTKRLVNLQKLLPPNRALDPNYARGRFSVEDAVLHMKTEWDQIMEMKNKNPAKVIFYSSQ